MTQEEKFSLHLPYKPKFKDLVTELNHGLDFENVSGVIDDFTNLNTVKPYFRSFDQLTKECVQPDYNDGEPFVPIIELAKMRNAYHKDFPVERAYKALCSDLKNLILPFDMVLKLLKWHFAIGFEKGEYIEVTNENNPY